MAIYSISSTACYLLVTGQCYKTCTAIYSITSRPDSQLLTGQYDKTKLLTITSRPDSLGSYFVTFVTKCAAKPRLLFSSPSPILVTIVSPFFITISYSCHCLLFSSLSPFLVTVSCPCHYLLSLSPSPVLVTISYPCHCLLSSSLSPFLVTVSFPCYCLSSSLSPFVVIVSFRCHCLLSLSPSPFVVTVSYPCHCLSSSLSPFLITISFPCQSFLTTNLFPFLTTNLSPFLITNLSPFLCSLQLDFDVFLRQRQALDLGWGHRPQGAVAGGWLQDHLKGQAARLLNRFVGCTAVHAETVQLVQYRYNIVVTGTIQPTSTSWLLYYSATYPTYKYLAKNSTFTYRTTRIETKRICITSHDKSDQFTFFFSFQP